MAHGEGGGLTAVWNSVVEWDNDGGRERAACRRTDANLFFPAGSTGSAVDQIEAAKAVCGLCAVQDACLRFAFETNQEAGVWGGTDEDERRRLRKVWRAGRQRRASAAKWRGDHAAPPFDAGGYFRCCCPGAAEAS